jgi:hypothetical protein
LLSQCAVFISPSICPVVFVIFKLFLGVRRHWRREVWFEAETALFVMDIYCIFWLVEILGV